jgi:hypothetical protein
VQATRQRAALADSACDAALHRRPQLAQASEDFLLAAPCFFVLEHQLRDRQAAALDLRQQFVATVEGVGQRRGVGDDAVFRRFILVDDEAATDRVVIARGDFQCRPRRRR